MMRYGEAERELRMQIRSRARMQHVRCHFLSASLSAASNNVISSLAIPNSGRDRELMKLIWTRTPYRAFPRRSSETDRRGTRESKKARSPSSLSLAASSGSQDVSAGHSAVRGNAEAKKNASRECAASAAAAGCLFAICAVPRK